MKHLKNCLLVLCKQAAAKLLMALHSYLLLNCKPATQRSIK